MCEGWRRERCSDIASCAVTAHRSLDRLSPLDTLPVSVLAGASSQLRRLDGSSCKDVWTADWACTQLHKHIAPPTATLWPAGPKRKTLMRAHVLVACQPQCIPQFFFSLPIIHWSGRIIACDYDSRCAR